MLLAVRCVGGVCISSWRIHHTITEKLSQIILNGLESSLGNRFGFNTNLRALKLLRLASLKAQLSHHSVSLLSLGLFLSGNEKEKITAR